MTAALLFDLDGTLVDTDHLHLEAINRLFAEHGVEVDRPTYTARIMGGANSAIAAEFLPHLEPHDALAVLDRKEEVYRGLVKDLTPIAGLGELLAWAEKRSIPCGVVTNAPRANAELVLAAIGLDRRFDTLVVSDEIASPKPHPLPYRTGLARLAARTEHSVAFEDSRSGMTSAIGAGLALVGMATSLAQESTLAHGAHLAVKDYRDPRLLDFIEARISAAR